MKCIRFLIVLSLCWSLQGQALDSRFHSVEEIAALFSDYVADSTLSGFFRVDTIGYSSREQRPILAAVISNNVMQKEDEARLLFVGQVHAEEVLGVEITLELISELLFPDPVDIQHAMILRQNLEIWIIPTLNPEGLAVVHDGLDVTYRKNKTDFSPDGMFPNGIFDYDPSIGNDVDGVDINRNFDFNWAFGDTFLEPDPSDYGSHFDYFRGPAPFSEAETQAVKRLAEERRFLASIVLHSSRSGRLSEKVFTSWEWENTKYSPDHLAMKTIGDMIATLILKEDGSDSYLSSWSKSRNGKAHDWFYSQTGCFQYLIECGTSNIQPDSALIEDTIDRVLPALYYLIDRSLGYNTDAGQLSGIIYDESTGSPIPSVVVNIAELTGSVLKTRSTDEFGRFRRLVNAGTYTLQLNHPAYFPREITLTANNSIVTQFSTGLVPRQTYQLDVSIVTESDWPSGEILRLTLTSEMGITDTLSLAGNTLSFSRTEGEWELTLISENGIAVQKKVLLDQDKAVNLLYRHPDISHTFSLNDESEWQTVIGDWVFEPMEIRSQADAYYANSDTLTATQTLVSTPLYVGSYNRIVCTIDHRYELEWDRDSIMVSIFDNAGHSVTESFSDHHWNMATRNILTFINEFISDSVRLLLKFKKDQSVNYRGWIINGLKLDAVNDNYLGTDNNSHHSITYALPTLIGPYPNPSTGNINLELSNWSGETTITVFNLLGQQVYRATLPNLSHKRQHWSLDFNNLWNVNPASGVYFLHIQNSERKMIKKCVLLNQ